MPPYVLKSTVLRGWGNTVDLSSEDVNDARSELTPRPLSCEERGSKSPLLFPREGGWGMSFLSQQHCPSGCLWNGGEIPILGGIRGGFKRFVQHRTFYPPLLLFQGVGFFSFALKGQVIEPGISTPKIW